MKVYLLKEKLFISFTPVLNVAINVYIENGLILSDIYHEGNFQSREMDCGIPLFNVDVMGRDAVNHLTYLLGRQPDDELIYQLRYVDAQVELFNSLLSSRTLMELFSDCPNLVWVMVLQNYYSQSGHVYEYLSRMKRRHLISWLNDIPSTENRVRILKKTALLSGRREELRWLARSLGNDEIMDAYKHHEVISLQELYLSLRYRILAGSQLLKSLTLQSKPYLRDYKPGMSSIEHTVKDSIRIGENIGIKKATSIVLDCRSREEVRALHDEWSNRLLETTKYIQQDIFFEEPSLVPAPGIKFIASVNALITEGREMKHCVASYKARALSGDAYIYSVCTSRGVRATVELVLSNGTYIPVQIKGKENSTLDNLTVNSITGWVEQENKRLITTLENYSQSMEIKSA
ncbi:MULTISPECIES: PcfJ domain-containing protein [Erwiniaceae]|uniref:PcfJ domain-containing protein n=1 Tax=Erwiniaceae TaxID=1903409 RepID=UPI00190AA04E|nr:MULTISPECIES: PcfJ domain-containing protein [Erwiniaceae]MBK0093336.1 PcfJ domain-containing protein [Erwinia sp. S59]MBK0127599.1 PcfJ domain-containing protein [Pantoea sp. S61]